MSTHTHQDTLCTMYASSLKILLSNQPVTWFTFKLKIGPHGPELIWHFGTQFLRVQNLALMDHANAKAHNASKK